MNAHPAPHPSTFALDVYFAQQPTTDASVREHLAQCQSCRNYLDSLVAAAAAPFAVPPPQRQRPPRHRLAPYLAVGLAAACALILAMRTSERSDVNSDSTDGVDDVVAKGTPAVQTIVRRKGGLALWNGRSPLHPHDVLAFRLACEGYARVTVFARPSPHGTPARVFAGDCPERPATLPFSLQVDERPGSESVTLVLSRRELEDEVLTLAANERSRNQDVWVVTLSFPKAGLP